MRRYSKKLMLSIGIKLLQNITSLLINDVIDKIEHNKYSDKSCTSSALSCPSNSQTVNIPLNKIGAFAKNSLY